MRAYGKTNHLAITKEGLAKHIGEAIAALLLLLFGTLFWVTFPTLLAPLWTRLEPQTLQRILGLSLLSVLVLLAYVLYLHRRLRNKLRIMFGIQWDRQENPYCPSCNKLLSMYGLERCYDDPGFFCISRKQNISMRNEAGESLTLVQAREHLRSK
jgi:hypothetical protein